MAKEATTDYGPLTKLIGTWQGDKGMDVAPDPDGKEENPYYETIVYKASGEVNNAERQKLAAVHYHEVVRRKSDDEIFHEQTGFWLWDAETETIMHSFTIPRAVAVIAAGKYKEDKANKMVVSFEVSANIDDPDWGIVQSPFMQKNAKTVSFVNKISVTDVNLTYSETTMVDIYGKRFEHTDENVLIKQD